MSNIFREEVKEKERHDKLYRKALNKVTLYMDPIHYQKFDKIKVATHPYHYAVHCLGNIHGKKVLDLGCGTGWFSIILAKRGGILCGIDISKEAIEIAKLRASVNNVSKTTEFKAMSFYDIDYPVQYFDIIIGLSVLHHSNDKELIKNSLYRVLKPGGKIIFSEPFGNSNFFEKIRLLVPVDIDEEDKSHWQEQIKYSDLEIFKDHFTLNYKEFHFFSRIDRIIKINWFNNLIRKLDHFLLNNLKFLRTLCKIYCNYFTKKYQ